LARTKLNKKILQINKEFFKIGQMENREAFKPAPVLPRALSVERIPESERPNLEDWKIIQGGKPEIVFREGGKVCDVIHRYVNPKDPSGTGAVVPTALVLIENDWKDNPVRFYQINGRKIGFPVAMLWADHGKPCELRSGGRGRYDRVKVN
jgi:hypothetical protein